VYVENLTEEYVSSVADVKQLALRVREFDFLGPFWGCISK